MKELKRAHGRICYECYGKEDGTPLLLLHGLGADHEMWQPQIEHYPQEGFRLIVPDLLAILEAEKVSCYALAGVSMGGIIAQALAIADSKRISKLILCDTFMDLETVKERLVGWATLQGLRLYARRGKERLAHIVASPYRNSPQVAEYFRRAVAAADLSAVIAARRAFHTAMSSQNYKAEDNIYLSNPNAEHVCR